MADATHSPASTIVRGAMMIPRIKSIEPMADYKLLVDFDEGRRVIYDVADDIRDIEAFEELRTLPGLFGNARLDSSRTCVVWNDRVDLPSDTIYEYGVSV